MASPNSYAASWFARFFHEYSLSIEQWRGLVERKTLECDELRQRIQDVESQRNAIAASRESQDRVIEGLRGLISSLKNDLQRHRNPTPAVYNVFAPTAPPPRPQTPWPPELMLSCTSSNFTSPASHTSAGHIEDTESLKKSESGPESEGSFKRQRMGES